MRKILQKIWHITKKIVVTLLLVTKMTNFYLLMTTFLFWRDCCLFVKRMVKCKIYQLYRHKNGLNLCLLSYMFFWLFLIEENSEDDPQKCYELTLYDKYCNSQLILSRKMFIWLVFTDRGKFTDIWTVWYYISSRYFQLDVVVWISSIHMIYYYDI